MIPKTILALCAVSFASTTANEVKIDSGRIKGSASGGVASWKGIPFAEPPGKLEEWIAKIPDYDGGDGQLLHPKDLKPADRDALKKFLDKAFGTPAAPTIHIDDEDTMTASCKAIIDGKEMAEHPTTLKRVKS